MGAEPADEVDRASITAFRDTTFLQPDRQLIFFVRQHTMSTANLIATLGVLAICGCAERHVSSSNQPAAVNTSPRTTEPDTNTPDAMMGTWHSRDGGILLELAGGERWKWWDLSEQSARPSEQPPMLGGSWFVRKGILFLRIEQ